MREQTCVLFVLKKEQFYEKGWFIDKASKLKDQVQRCRFLHGQVKKIKIKCILNAHEISTCHLNVWKMKMHCELNYKYLVKMSIIGHYI